MENEIRNNLILLKKYKHKLTTQQYKTFKGQILKYDIIGFRKGLKKVLRGEE